MNEQKILIIGAGLAGLSCASYLNQAGYKFTLIEAHDQVGGRVRTDVVQGYQLDRGFQIFLDAYPEAKALLNYETLELKAFKPGAIIRKDGYFCVISDPMRNPSTLLTTITAPVGSFADKLKILKLRQYCSDDQTQNDRQSAEDFLYDFGFSEKIIQTFFRPFFGGVFLDTSLQTNQAQFQFVFNQLANGNSVLPTKGMQAIPNQLVNQLPDHCIRLNTKVQSIRDHAVILQDGETIEFDTLFVATDGMQAAEWFDSVPTQYWNGVTCLYYTADKAPFNEPYLVLNGNRDGPINNLAVLTNICPSYAPDGKVLISVSVLGEHADNHNELNTQVLNQAKQWYRQEAENWELLKIYNIPYALPDQSCRANQEKHSTFLLRDGVYLCGDYTCDGSINGALKSGRLAAEAFMQA